MVREIHKMQREFLCAVGSRFVFAADELYIRAGKELPGFEEYEDFTQIENGVGLVAKFFDEIDQGDCGFRCIGLPECQCSHRGRLCTFYEKNCKKAAPYL